MHLCQMCFNLWLAMLVQRQGVQGSRFCCRACGNQCQASEDPGRVLQMLGSEERHAWRSCHSGLLSIKGGVLDVITGNVHRHCVLLHLQLSAESRMLST